MLYLLKKKNLKEKIFIGDNLNLIYRFKGVFFVMMGYCVYNRLKSISVFAKKKNYFLYFSILFINLRDIYKFETFYFNSKKWKTMYRLKN